MLDAALGSSTGVPTRKRLFIGLCLLAVVTVLGLLSLIVYLAANWSQPVNRLILMAVSGVFLMLLGVVALGIFGILLTICRCRSIPPLQHFMRVALSLLYPLVVLLGGVLSIDREKIRRSFIEVNNQMVRARREPAPASQILILAPHCLQKADCPNKITQCSDNCKRCGGCQVVDLLQIRDRYGVRLAFATGGTLARRFVARYRPRAIIAIACERDLASGIQDASPIPVLGILNQRPFGPCFNTRVDLQRVEEAVIFLTGRSPAGGLPGAVGCQVEVVE